MRSLAIYCVNYNSYECLTTFLKSVDVAAKEVCEFACVYVYVADNTEYDFKEINDVLYNASLKVFPYYENLGYFGSVKKMMTETKPESFDFIIISNVDVEICSDALKVLISDYMDKELTIGWIAPQIYSTVEKRDKNPQAISRYSFMKLRLLKFMFQHYLLCILYRKTIYKRKKMMLHSKRDVYAGHGSFIILTRQYIEKCGIIDYPVFLFCEEIYLAEQCYNHELRVIYDPVIRIVDKEHISTGKLPSKSYFKYNADALQYIIDTFYLRH